MIRKIQWYVNRLRSMGMPEIRYRVSQVIVQQREKRFGFPKSEWDTVDFNKEWQNFSEGKRPFNLFLSPKEKQSRQTIVKEHFLKEFNFTISTAEQLLAGKINIFGNHYQLDSPVDWHQDPKTKNKWPKQQFWGDIDIRDGRTIGGVKWVWELNRHHHLVTLVKAYYLTDDEKYAQAVCEQLERWIEENPLGFGVNWTSSLELALRIINWSWVLLFLQGSNSISQSLFTKLCKSVHSQAAYIDRHLSKFSSANNHLVGEAAGLFFAGTCFPFFEESQHWQTKGLNIVNEQIPLQIYEDGTPAEQTIEYLTFLMGFNFQVIRLARLNDLQIPRVWFERIKRVDEFITAIMIEDGSFPTIGDGDDAWVVRLDDSDGVSRLKSLRSLIALELGLDKLPYKDETAFWLYGETAVHQVHETQETPKSKIFPTGGLAVLRSDDYLLTFDCGPLGYLETAAHGHADALSITLSKGNQPFLIDPNTFAYQEGYEWRDYFRSTSAHNTVVIDGQNQSQLKGAFLWGEKAECQIMDWNTNDALDFVVANHDGYQSRGVIHQRKVEWQKPHQLTITDEIQGNSIKDITLYWHFPHDAQLEKIENGYEILINSESFQIDLSDFSDWKSEIIIGESAPIQGWQSFHYGHRTPSPVLKISNNLALPVRITTNFSL